MNNRTYISKVQALLICVGFVIGSGIFFRADNILIATQGNVLIAILGWLFLGTTIIFGALSASLVAHRADGVGGIGSYIEHLYGKKAGYLVGFFMSTMYAPIMISVMGIVLMGYATTLFGWEQLVAGNGFYIAVIVLLLLVFLWNVLSTAFAARVSSLATLIKVIPLIVIGIFGLIFGDVNNVFQAGMGANEAVANADPNAGFLALFMAPFVSMGFAFDGWISVAALSNELENPKRDLPKILVIGITIITTIYIIYFTGVSMLMDPSEIIASGDAHITIIANDIFGSIGGNLLITGIIISVLGTLNSNVMAGIRYPMTTARENTFMFKDKMSTQNKKTNTPLFGSLYCIVIAMVFVGLYALQEINGAFAGITFDDIPVFIFSVFYLCLFWGVYKIGKTENLGTFKTIVAPLIAAIGQIFILIAFYVTNDQAFIYTLVIIIVMVIGYLLRNLGTSQS